MAVEKIKNIIYTETLGIVADGIEVGEITLLKNDVSKQCIFHFDKAALENYEKVVGYSLDLPGVDLSLGLSEYVRAYPPTFMSGYLPPNGRSDLPVILSQFDLPTDHYDMWEFMRHSFRPANDSVHVYHKETVDNGVVTEKGEKPVALWRNTYLWGRAHNIMPYQLQKMVPELKEKYDCVTDEELDVRLGNELKCL